MAAIAFLEPYERSTPAPKATSSNSEIIPVLILGALKKIDQARQAHLKDGSVAKGFYIGRATSIIDALRDTLDVESGGENALDYDRVYQHIDNCLLIAVEEDLVEPLEHARNAICQISACWQASNCSTSLLKGTA